MAGNHSLTGALLASALLHASMLYAPLSQIGTGDAGRAPVLEAVLRPPAEKPAVMPALLSPEAVVQPAEDHSRSFAPPPQTREVSAREPEAETAAGRGDEVATLLPVAVATPILYYRPHELTRRPILRRPVLQEEAGRLYPVSETRLLVRIGLSGGVDEVILMAADHEAMADEAVRAFRQADYFPGMIGSSPARAELLIQIVSSPTALVVSF